MKVHVFMDQSEVSAFSTRYSRCLRKQLVFLVLFISVLELTSTAVSKGKESTLFLGRSHHDLSRSWIPIPLVS